jgi:hypothetical protein
VDDALHEGLLLDADLTLELPNPRIILIFFLFLLDDFLYPLFLTWWILRSLAAT